MGALWEIITYLYHFYNILWYLLVEQVSASSRTHLFIVSEIAQVVKMPATNHSPDTRNKQRKGKEGQRRIKGTPGMCKRESEIERERLGVDRVVQLG